MCVTIFLTALLLLHQSLAQNGTLPTYIVTFTSQAVGGSTETLCAQLFQPAEPLSMKVLLHWSLQKKIILEEENITQDLYHCIPFQVPDVTRRVIAQIEINIEGNTTFLGRMSKILILPPTIFTIIYTDKPIYKPGQAVKLRVISLDSSFLTKNQVFHTVEIKDPVSNRIAQWLNQSTTNGILDLSYTTSAEATQGDYTVSVRSDKNAYPRKKDFKIKEYVLPKYEITLHLPQLVTMADSGFELKVCAKYTYGKPVMGNVKVKISRVFFRKNSRAYEKTTDKRGCASLQIKSEDFAFNKEGHMEFLRVESNVEEHGTGVILSKNGEIHVRHALSELTFEDAPDTYKPGISYDGKIKATDPGSNPLRNGQVKLLVSRGLAKSDQWKLTTDNKGFAYFSLNTTTWDVSEVKLTASFEEISQMLPNTRQPSTERFTKIVRPFYSKSKSFLKLVQTYKTLDCDKEASITAKYIIQGSELKKQETLDFFYMIYIPTGTMYQLYQAYSSAQFNLLIEATDPLPSVMSRGSLRRHGHWSVTIKKERENKGELLISLTQLHALAPVAQIVVYTLLPGGELVADAGDFPIQKCFANKVVLNFTSPIELPGAKTSLSLNAHPGSFCSVRAIDQSVLLLKPENELTVDSVFDLLPVHKLSEYPPEFKPCFESSEDYYWIHDPNSYDSYSVFKGVGIKILTSSERKTRCFFARMYDDMLSGSSLGAEPPEKIRKFFPETWIWDLVPVGQTGSIDMEKTVPDTITTWTAGAFCTSPIGFGIAPNVDLTAFQPFFVSLTLPYSVIFGEVFTLKATVFNYLSSCIMVKVTLADSKQLSSQPCDGCTYTNCLCGDKRKTFRWMVTPAALGEVDIEVSAEALHTEMLCSNEVVAVPEKGRIDTVLKKLLVEPQGTKQSRSHNDFICLSGNSVEKKVSLKLPDVYVEGSAKAFVSVLGDLMGRALNNVDRLLEMPYGCGEQNMIRFAPNIFILQYLESSDQLTSEIKAKAIPFLESGYQRELNYKHSDGSYSAFGKSDKSGNTWLTAFVMKCFGSAKRYIFVEDNYIYKAKAWLGSLQKKNGCFTSVGKLFNSELKGGISDEISLSAYITVALLEIGTDKSDPVVVNALGCLKNATGQLDNTYVTALLSYAFTLAGDDEMRSKLYSHLHKQAKVTESGRYWQVQEEVNSLDVEITSYVLLTLLSGSQLPEYGIDYSRTVAHWLVLQQNEYGGFFSTQDTVVALQALAKFSAATYSRVAEGEITVTSPSHLKYKFTINQDNRLLYQETKLQEVPGDYKFVAKGSGCFLMQFSVTYHIPPSTDYPAFSISASSVGTCGQTDNVVALSVNVRYNGKREETNMAIINVKLLSGFKLQEASLKPMRVDPTVKRIDREDGNIIIYLDELKRHEPKTYSLEMLEEIPVRNLKPAVIKVYDYYQTMDEAVTEYNSPCAAGDDLNV